MTYEGRVFNKNNMPLAGMTVSDGRNVTKTDSEGYFFLPGFERTRMIYICVLTTKMNDWYISTEGHKGTYDFWIDPVMVSSDFCFLHTSDTEIETRESNDWISFAREQVEIHKPAFFAHTGDLCRNEGVRKHFLVMNEKTVGCPVRYAIGNHDYIGEKYGEEIYEKLYGPIWYSFDCGEIHFVVLAIGRGDNPSGYEPEDQWKWLLNDLAAAVKNKRLIVLDHDSCIDEKGFCMVAGDVTIDFRKYGLLAWVYGHYHFNLMHEYDGVFNISTARPDSGGIDSSAAGVRKISLCGHALASEMLYNILPVENSDAYIWKTNLPGQMRFAVPFMVGEDIIACTADDGYPRACGVFRISGKNGEIKWSYPTKSGIKNNAVVDGNRIYAEDCTGWLYCIDAETGTLIWKVNTPLDRGLHTRTGVLIVDRYVFAGSSAQVHAYDKETGILIWQAERNGGEGSPARYVYDEKNRYLIVSAHWRNLYALDIKNGKRVWVNERPKTTLWFRTATPLVKGGVIYTVSLDSIVIIDADTGKTIKEKELGCRVDVAGAPVLDNGILYYPTAQQGVLAVDADTLEVLNRFPTGQAALFTSPYIYGDMETVECTPQIVQDKLIFAASDATVRVYNKNTAEQEICIHLGAPSITTPIVGKDFMITGDFKGNITKYMLDI